MGKTQDNVKMQRDGVNECNLYAKKYTYDGVLGIFLGLCKHKHCALINKL
jgi:hypothetical protein